MRNNLQSNVIANQNINNRDGSSVNGTNQLDPNSPHIDFGTESEIQSPGRPPIRTGSRTHKNTDNQSRRSHGDKSRSHTEINNNDNDYERIVEEENEEDYNDELDDLVYEEDEYSNEGEEDEDDEDIEVHTLFDEANDYIESLKGKVDQTQNQNNENEQTIQSLRNELGELQKINDNLESQLYKYQYDVNRITDVLMNDAHPSKEELEREESGIEDMTEQETNLYNLLNKAAELRETQTSSKDKIAVFEKDVQELISKNAHLQEVEEIKNELSIALDHEKQRANDLE